MTTNWIPNRRAVLVTGLGAAGAALLAACSSSSSSSTKANGARSSGSTEPTGGGSPSTDTSSTDTSSTDTSSTDTSSTDTSTGTSTGTKSLATLADIPVGSAVSVVLPGGKPGVVARPTATTAACFSAICTHLGCTVTPVGKALDCPCHGSTFDAATGKVLGGPAPSPLPAVKVTVSGGKVLLA